MKVVYQDLRTTKRALWLARAEIAKVWKLVHNAIHLTHHSKMTEKWGWVELKCHEKAEEYK